MMEDVSVSKGVFVYAKRKVGQKRKNSTKCPKFISIKNKPWYKTFKETWYTIEHATANVNANAFRQILFDLKSFVSKVNDLHGPLNEIPTGILLAGVNLPDHNVLVHMLISDLQPITPYIATVWSRNASTLKHLIEETVYQLINSSEMENKLENYPDIKKSHSNFCALQAWCKESNRGNRPLIIIMPDFESFTPRILHDFILILNSNLRDIKFVLIFGVATTLHIVHRSLSYDATSKLKIQVFHTKKQTEILSDVLDKIILSPSIPFKLTGRAFRLLVDIFLFYDFSVNGFLQSYKLCMWRHFFNCDEKIICCNQEEAKSRVTKLTSENLKYLKKNESIRHYLRSLNKIKIDDSEFREILKNLIPDYHKFFKHFLLVLQCLFELSKSLPSTIFGKTFREMYADGVDKVNLCETEKYKEAIKCLSFLSKEELLKSSRSILSILESDNSSPRDVIEKLKYHLKNIEAASLEITVLKESDDIDMDCSLNKSTSRLQWREKLKLVTQKVRYSPYKEAQVKFIEFLDREVFVKYLRSYCEVPLNEIFCCDDKQSVYNLIRGPMKAAIHNNLNEPQNFLDCNCCCSESVILPTHPDLSIIYKLHLENRKMINLYDLLQSFLSIVDENRGDNDDVDPLLQARFTRAVAELQFLGFIKATRKKTDHVKRLTT